MLCKDRRLKYVDKSITHELYSSLKVTQILSKELIFKINDSFENALTNTSAIFHLVPFVT